MDLSKKELETIASLLGEYSILLGERGCNDGFIRTKGNEDIIKGYLKYLYREEPEKMPVFDPKKAGHSILEHIFAEYMSERVQESIK